MKSTTRGRFGVYWLALAGGVALLAPCSAAAQFQQLKVLPGEGGTPHGGVVVGTDGTLYGTTTYGGAWAAGSVFKLSPQPGGTFVFSTVASFNGFTGAGPVAAPVIGPDGALYGTTEWGGNSFGTVYRVTTAGALTVLHAFAPVNGKHPKATLMVATDGALYGTASGGGSSTTCSDCGTVFAISPAGVFRVVHSFNGTDGAHPSAPLVQAADGNLYGTTVDAGAEGGGTVFRLTPGGALTTIHHFTSSEGQKPNGLIQTADGSLYGTTRLGGANGGGTLFSMDVNGRMTAQWSLTLGTGTGPEAGLLAHPDGALYGTARFGGTRGTVFRLSAGVIDTIHMFTIVDGAEPVAPLTVGANGVLYGSTSRGGPRGEGTVFTVTTSGVLTTLTDFGFEDGAQLATGLTTGIDGTYYGVASAGGLGSGSIFRVDTSGSFNVVHRFPFTGEQGMLPNCELVAGWDGALYGTTHMAGAGAGTVFRLSSAGTVSVAHSFAGTDGDLPRCLARSTDGSLFGTTVLGGSHNRGTVYRIDAGGAFSTLHTFVGPEGANPDQGVLEGPDGFLYGTTAAGGANDAGVIFRMDPASGDVTTLFAFPQKVDYATNRRLFLAADDTMYLTTWDYAVPPVSRLASNGTLTSATSQPLSGPSGLIQGSDGLLYGTTHGGGSANKGTVFQLHPDGSVNYLHAFDSSYPRGPLGRLMQAPDRAFYGTTFGGGATGGGTVFRFSAVPVTVSVPGVVRPYGSTAAVTVVVTTDDDVPVAGKTITVRINGTPAGSGVTNASGTATIGSALPSDPAGLEVGTYPTAIAAAFSGDDGFQAAASVGSLTVTRATPALSWTSPLPIPQGAPLGAAQLNATAPVPGSFEYTPGLGVVLTAGLNALTVVFTPADPVHYTSAAATVTIAVVPAPAVTRLDADISLPAAAGSTIIWNAVAEGGIAPLQYQFWRLDSGAWTMVRDYQASPTYAWTTTPADVGLHALQVWVRSAGSAAPYDTWRGSGFFTITSVPQVNVSSLTSNVPLPARPGQSMTWTASASGGTAPLSYKFWLYCTSTGTWILAQDYSTTPAFTMTPMTADTCAVQVWVRSSGATSPYDAWMGSGMFAITAPAVNVTAIVPNVPPPFVAGVPIRWTAAAGGGVGSLEYKFWRYRSSTNAWSVLRDYSPFNHVTYTPAVGAEAVQVWVRSAGSTEPLEAWRGTGMFVVNEQQSLSVTSLSPAPGPPFSVGSPITWTATTSGGLSPVEFQFWLYHAGGWTLMQDYSTQSSVSWTPPDGGSYAIQVWVRSAGSAADYDAWLGTTFFEVTLVNGPR